MKQSYLDDIQHIVESVSIDIDGTLRFRGQPYEGYNYPEVSDERNLLNNLNSLIYSSCYTRNSHIGRQKMVALEDDSFLQGLRKANSSREGYDCGWTVEEIEMTGNILVRKGSVKRYTYAGDFIREYFGQGPLQRGESVNIRVLPEYGREPEDESFYFVFGETLLDNNNSALVRLYFNIAAEGAAPLITFITRNLNRFSIPFQFKCLNQARSYTRCDSAVLYIDKRYCAIVGDLLSEGYTTLKAWFNPEVPMFTRQLAPGISFAENPFSSAESFGTSRCKIIAQGLVNAWKEKQTKEGWSDFIIKNIYQNYLKPDTLHLNPNSKYPYHFPHFEN